jgi:hypothetical protein
MTKLENYRHTHTAQHIMAAHRIYFVLLTYYTLLPIAVLVLKSNLSLLSVYVNDRMLCTWKKVKYDTSSILTICIDPIYTTQISDFRLHQNPVVIAYSSLKRHKKYSQTSFSLWSQLYNALKLMNEPTEREFIIG